MSEGINTDPNTVVVQHDDPSSKSARAQDYITWDIIVLLFAKINTLQDYKEFTFPGRMYVHLPDYKVYFSKALSQHIPATILLVSTDQTKCSPTLS